MSVFYFDVRKSGRKTADPAGVELPSVAAAVECANAYLRRLDISTEERSRRSFEIRNGHDVVATVPFSTVLPGADRRAS